MAQANTNPEPENSKNNVEETGEIIFIRKTGYSGWAIPFKTFIEEDLSSRINNNRYSKHLVKAGVYNCSAQFYGKKRNHKRDQVAVEVKPGEKKYVMLNMHYGFLVAKMSVVEISEESAMNILSQGVKDDPKY